MQEDGGSGDVYVTDNRGIRRKKKEMQRKIREERKIIKNVRRRKMKFQGQYVRRQCLLEATNEKMGSGVRRRESYRMLDSCKTEVEYEDTEG